MRFDVHPTAMKQKQGAPLNRTHPEKSTNDNDMYNRAFPHRERSVFLCWGCDESVLPAMRQARF